MPNIDDEYVESFAAKERRKNKSTELDLGFLKEEVRFIWIYPLTSLTGKKIDAGIRISNEKTTLAVTTFDKGKRYKAFLEVEKTYELNELIDSIDPNEKLISNSNPVNLTINKLVEFDENSIYLMTFEELDSDNFTETNKFICKNIDFSRDLKQTEVTFVPLGEFSSSFNARPMEILIMEPITEKIKAINISSPEGALIGNIKAINNNGKIINLYADEKTEMFPKLVFPFQTQPHLSTIEYWASLQIIKFKQIFDYLDSKNIGYDQEFSLADFLKLGSEVNYPPLRVDIATRITYNFSPLNLEWSGRGGPWLNKEVEIERVDIENGKVVKFLTIEPTGTSGPKISQPTEITYTVNASPPYGETGRNLTPKGNFTNVEVYPINVGKTTSAFQQICQMLTESFWKDLEFDGAIKISEKDGQKFEEINDNDLYLLRDKYSGQDRYNVTTNNWISWKNKNQDLVNENKDIIKRIENALALLSGHIKSNYSINKGDSDDYKILLPFYFELQNKIENPTGYVAYKDIVVKLKSAYGEFTSDSFHFTNNNISKSHIFELEYNHFVFPELTKKIETAMIPSSMPVDQQLSNGEYSKYLLWNFSNDQNLKDTFFSRYGSGNMTNDSTEKNTGSFNLESPTEINEIEISTFYGYGDWDLELVGESDNKKSLKVTLFSRFDNTKSLVSLIL